MGQKEDNLLNKAKKSLKVRLSLVMLLIVGIVFAGIGLMVYFYVLKEESHPLAGPVFVGMLILGLAMIVFLMIRSVRNMKELGEITASWLTSWRPSLRKSTSTTASPSASARQPPPKAGRSSSGTLAPTCATYS